MNNKLAMSMAGAIVVFLIGMLCGNAISKPPAVPQECVSALAEGNNVIGMAASGVRIANDALSVAKANDMASLSEDAMQMDTLSRNLQASPYPRYYADCMNLVNQG